MRIFSIISTGSLSMISEYYVQLVIQNKSYLIAALSLSWYLFIYVLKISTIRKIANNHFRKKQLSKISK